MSDSKSNRPLNHAEPMKQSLETLKLMELTMKKISFYLLTIILVLILAACGSVTSDTNPNTGENRNTADGRTFEIPLETQLMLGTVKLDETAYAIDSEQAADLLPLWKALRSLSGSDTTAQAEVEAVFNQIQDTMTTDQIDTIEDMDLTMADMAGVAEILGVEFGLGGGGRFGDITPEMQETMQAMRESGEFPGGGGGFGGGQGRGGGQGPGGGFGGDEVDPSVRETAIAERGGTFNRGFGINTELLDAVIDFLEAKIR